MAKLILVLLSGSVMCFGAAPLATVASDAPFILDGKTVSVQGVVSWPVLSGDKISTQSAPALISFRDGSTVSLLPNSVLSLNGTVTKPEAVLETGELDYNLAKDSNLSVSRVSDISKPSRVLINRATVTAVVASSLVGGSVAGVRLAGGGSSTSTVGAADLTTSAATDLAVTSTALRPPPLSRFQ